MGAAAEGVFYASGWWGIKGALSHLCLRVLRTALRVRGLKDACLLTDGGFASAVWVRLRIISVTQCKTAFLDFCRCFC